MKRMISVLIVTALLLALIALAATMLSQQAPTTGTYLFSPSFSATTAFPLGSLEYIETEARKIVIACADPTFSDTVFSNCLDAEIDALNVQDPLVRWAYGDSCDSKQFIASDRKSVFCVIPKETIYHRSTGWSRTPLVFMFALDFSDDAYQTAKGERPPRCMDGTDYMACSPNYFGAYCAVDIHGEFVIRHDCRGFDIHNPEDDCSCGDYGVCRSDGHCELII